jgi:hypothetical protein
MTKAVSFLASLAAVVAAALTADKFLSHHPDAVQISGWGAIGIILGIGISLISEPGDGLYVGILALTTTFGLSMMHLNLHTELLGSKFAFFAGLAVSMGALYAYRQHRKSIKCCPDCAESVKAHANVCRHCHYRFSSEA